MITRRSALAGSLFAVGPTAFAAAANPKQFGAAADGVTDDTRALRAMFASGATSFDLGSHSYLVDVQEGDSLTVFRDRGGVRIRGTGSLISRRPYTGPSLTPMFVFDACTDCTLELSFEGTPIRDKSNPILGIGYRGATFVQIKNGCRNITVNGRLRHLRYGVLSGSYLQPAEGRNRTIRTTLDTVECGYPVAHYLAEDVQATIRSVGSHRSAYLAGCDGGFVHAEFRDQYIAPIQVLLTDAKTGPGRSRGCSNIDVVAHDIGSTIFVPYSHCAAISLSRPDPGLIYENLSFDVYVKASDVVATPIGGFRMDSLAKTVVHSARDLPMRYESNWRRDIELRNIRVTGTVDRSEQTQVENRFGEIYVSTFDGLDFAKISDFSVENFNYRPGRGNKPRGFWFFMPGLTGPATFRNCDFSSVAPFRYATNGTSTSTFERCTLRGSFEGGNDAPYLSAVTFTDCRIASPANQPMQNKRFVRTTIG